jgi:hypothetical protein
MANVKTLLKKHGQLNQMDNVKVESHVQRDKKVFTRAKRAHGYFEVTPLSRERAQTALI